MNPVPSAAPSADDPPGGAAGGSRGPIVLGYRTEPPGLCPAMTRWQVLAVALFFLSFPLLVGLLCLRLMW